MDDSKKSTSNHLTCDVCKIDFNSNADFALHEFSKKHCDNLIRLAKQKPVISKQKTKAETPQLEKQLPKVNSVPHTGSFAKYGYFVPGEIYVHSEVSREFNTDYDPYLQKFAENPFKEKPNVQPQSVTSTICSISSLSKKKKKKIKLCQVCNMTFLTLPEYETHMKSPQHIWKLKVTGMGVSAHFVKASTDLHTTDIMEESNKPNNEEKEEPISTVENNENPSSEPFPLLYCSDCDLLFNSPQQYNTHISGKLHFECAQKKAESKAKNEKLENPLSNQLYCYSCKISLNNLFQYNEHKNGKKHKTRCRTLIRRGITIPPEERIAGMPNPNPNKPVVYPELYEKLVLEKQKQKEPAPTNLPTAQPVDEKDNMTSSMQWTQTQPSSEPLSSFSCNLENKMDAQTSLMSHTVGEMCTDTEKFQSSRNHNESCMLVETVAQSKNDNSTEACHESAPIQLQISCHPSASDVGNSNIVNFDTNCVEKRINNEASMQSSSPGNESKTKFNIVTDDKPVQCSICNESFDWQSQLDTHLGTEDHLEKILECKLSGRSESEILKLIFSDRNVVKANNIGKFSCSICNVTTDNSAEFEQHLNSIVHKYTEKDYETKRVLEVKSMVSRNEKGLYFCKLCQEGWTTLVDYTQHLHSVKHKSVQRTQRAKVVVAKRKILHLQKQRLMQGGKKKNLSLRRIKADKQPGIRTKISGIATNLHTGAQAPVPNLEPLEPKIDDSKNVNIGVSDNTTANSNDNNNDKLKIPKTKKRNQAHRPKVQNAKQPGRGRGSFIPSRGSIPPLMPGPPYYRFRPDFIQPSRNWAPFSSPRPPVFGPYCGMPSPTGNPYFRPHRFLCPPWPRPGPPFPRS